ncbi:MAG: NAD(P)/FAD-dependent oxidoreductase [Chthoniobacterales bacterium]
MSRKTYPVIIIGGGPAGAATALYLLRLGITPVIIERSSHPRFHVGESLTGPTAIALNNLGLGPKIEAMNYPIKEGVTFYGPEGKNDFWVPLVKRDENFDQVPNYTWNVMRSTFDKIIFDGAVERGAIWMQATAVAPIVENGEVVGVTIRTADGATEDVFSEVLVDASGIATFLANHRVTGKKVPGSSDKQIALFTQFANTERDNGPDRQQAPGNTLLYYEAQYHWGWFIPVSQDLTSVGIVVKSDYFRKLGMAKEEFMLHMCRHLSPALSKRLPDLTPQEPINTVPNFSYQVMDYTGKGFLCVGDAHRFIDPIFAYGVYFGVQEGEFAANAIARHLSGDSSPNETNPFADYERLCNEGNDVVEDTIGVLWEYPLAFQRIVTARDRAAALDLLSGRIYGEEGAKNPARIAFGKLMETKRGKDRHSRDPRMTMPAPQPALAAVG